MKATCLTAAGAIALTFALAACIPQPDVPLPPPPPPTAAPAPTPRPAPPPAVEPVYENYLDAPQTPGDWKYAREPGETLAQFGTGISEPRFIMRCAGGAIGLAYVSAREQAAARAMTIRTETLTRTLEARPVMGQDDLLAAVLEPSDPLLDAMAIIKGRFAVAVQGQPTLYLPAWVEVSRVIEDCR